jgi:hypothetical protein
MRREEWHNPKCVKKCYRSRGAALRMIKNVKKRSSRSKVPQRVYFCKTCRSWHLTSLKGYHGKSFPKGNS